MRALTYGGTFIRVGKQFIISLLFSKRKNNILLHKSIEIDIHEGRHVEKP